MCFFKLNFIVFVKVGEKIIYFKFYSTLAWLILKSSKCFFDQKSILFIHSIFSLPISNSISSSHFNSYNSAPRILLIELILMRQCLTIEAGFNKPSSQILYFHAKWRSQLNRSALIRNKYAKQSSNCFFSIHKRLKLAIISALKLYPFYCNPKVATEIIIPVLVETLSLLLNLAHSISDGHLQDKNNCFFG
jgi:hypothetical protein